MKAPANRGMPYSLRQFKDDPGSRQNQKTARKLPVFPSGARGRKNPPDLRGFLIFFPFDTSRRVYPGGGGDESPRSSAI
jgi:hypothetical protein